MSEGHNKLEGLLLRADGDDAPIRVRRGRSRHARLWLSVLAACIAFGVVANYMDLQRLIQGNGPLKTEPPVVVRASPTTRDTFQPQQNNQQVDNYDEQVNRLLAEPVARSSATTPKQTVFNDTNYVPTTQVNTISMAAQQPAAPSLNAAPQQEYVTVVQETKPSCWPFKPGSINCRNYKKAIKRAHNQNCYNSAHSYTEACRRATLYNPVR